MSKEDIKKLIDKQMKKVQSRLDTQFKEISENAKGLNGIIDNNNEKLKL